MATRTATAEVEVEQAPRLQTATHEVGSTRRLVWLLVKKCLAGTVVTLAAQNAVTLPHWWGIASPVLDVLGIKVGA